jgi:hypothetical protein
VLNIPHHFIVSHSTTTSSVASSSGTKVRRYKYLHTPTKRALCHPQGPLEASTSATRLASSHTRLQPTETAARLIIRSDDIDRSIGYKRLQFEADTSFYSSKPSSSFEPRPRPRGTPSASIIRLEPESQYGYRFKSIFIHHLRYEWT